MNDRQQLSHFRSFLHNAVQSGIGSQPERKQLFEKALADSLNPTAESFEKLPKVLKMILTERKCVPTEISDKALLDFVTEVVSCALNEYDTLRENCIFSFEYRVSKMLSVWVEEDAAHAAILQNALNATLKPESNGFKELPYFIKHILGYPNGYASRMGHMVISHEKSQELVSNAMRAVIDKLSINDTAHPTNSLRP